MMGSVQHPFLRPPLLPEADQPIAHTARVPDCKLEHNLADRTLGRRRIWPNMAPLQRTAGPSTA